LVDLISLGLRSDITKNFRGDVRPTKMQEIAQIATEIERRKFIAVPGEEKRKDVERVRRPLENREASPRAMGRPPAHYNEPLRPVYARRNNAYSGRNNSPYSWTRRGGPTRGHYNHHVRSEPRQSTRTDTNFQNFDLSPFRIVPPPCLACGKTGHSRAECIGGSAGSKEFGGKQQI
jgi:hypothetical protein